MLIFNKSLESFDSAPYDRMASICLLAPDLFSGKYKTVLNVGASMNRFHYSKLFEDAGFEVTVLEAYKPNVDFLKSLNKWNIIEGDVSKYKFNKKFDVTFWWHGPEHVTSDVLPSALENLESATNYITILGSPYGKYEQGAYGGNPYEVHCGHYTPDVFELLGYTYLTIGEKDVPGSNITSVKYRK